MTARLIKKPNWQRLRDGQLDWDIFRFRDRVIRSTRNYFQTQGFIEIDAPLLTPYPTLDPNIESIPAPVRQPTGNRSTLFLHTSPEHALKKCLAAGADKVFFLGKVFRNGEQTSLHNPEFTLVEWYRTHADYSHIMEDSQNLIQAIMESLDLKKKGQYQEVPIDWAPPWPRVSLNTLFKEKTNIDLTKCSDLSSLQSQASRLGIRFDTDDDWESLFFKIYIERIEPGLGYPVPRFLVDYPSVFGLMAKEKAGEPGWVERCELYIGGLELANGYSELTDPNEQKKRFIQDQKRKQQSGLDYPIDDELIEALESGIPPCAGIALGLDRLIMLFLDLPKIDQVMLFPFSQMKT